MIEVTARYFAAFRERAGRDTERPGDPGSRHAGEVPHDDDARLARMLALESPKRGIGIIFLLSSSSGFLRMPVSRGTEGP